MVDLICVLFIFEWPSTEKQNQFSSRHNFYNSPFQSPPPPPLHTWKYCWAEPLGPVTVLLLIPSTSPFLHFVLSSFRCLFLMMLWSVSLSVVQAPGIADKLWFCYWINTTGHRHVLHSPPWYVNMNDGNISVGDLVSALLYNCSGLFFFFSFFK